MPTDLYAGLLDDAALFPPSELAPAAAVPAHLDHRAAWYADLVGPFVCAPGFLAAARAALPVGEVLDLALVVPGGPAAVAAAVDAVLADDRLRLVAVEVAADDAAAAVAALDAALPANATGYVEVPRGEPLDALVGTRHRAKLRTGGTTAAAFPAEAEVAAFVAGAVARGLPFKCTAGLHHAVRHTDPATGFEQHGFLNVLLATAAATGGADETELARLLAERDPAAVAAQVATLGPTVRRSFVSVGTCSVAEPVDDLVALGLLAERASQDPGPSRAASRRRSGKAAGSLRAGVRPQATENAAGRRLGAAQQALDPATPSEP